MKLHLLGTIIVFKLGIIDETSNFGSQLKLRMKLMADMPIRAIAMIFVIPFVICLSGHAKYITDLINCFSILFDLTIPSEPYFLRGAKL